MTFTEAALRVLRDEQRPLTTREITEIALKRGLVTSSGKTPTATMSARLYLYSLTPGAMVLREFEPGPGRAKRGSVRWSYVSSPRV